MPALLVGAQSVEHRDAGRRGKMSVAATALAKRDGIKAARIDAARGLTVKGAAESALNFRIQTCNKKHDKPWRATLETCL